jgi:hypothetical protein
LQFPKVKKLAWIKYGIGIGIGLFAIDRYPVNLIGLLILFIFTVLYTKDMDWKTLDWGSKWVYIPMLVIFGTTVLRLVIYHTISEVFAVSFFAIMIVLYLISRQYGKDIVRILLMVFAVVAISQPVMLFLHIGKEYDGGIVGNYNRAAVLLGIIAFMYMGKWKWLLIFIATIAMLFTGSLEGLLLIGVTGIVILLRKDWNKKLWIPFGALAVIALIWVFSGAAYNFYYQTIVCLNFGEVNALNSRVIVYKEALGQLSLLGHGYTNSFFNNSTVHNVPLIIADQLGVVAALAWVVATLYALIKTKWKYLWVIIITACAFDHMIWTGLAPLWWLSMGLSADKIDNDLIYRSKDASLPSN